MAERPAVVAVELPETLEEAYLEAIQRLPQISVIFYNDPIRRSQSNGLRRGEVNDESEQAAVFVPIEPADPFVEAIRSAQEIGAQVVFADPDTNERPHLPDSYPDSYALTSIPLSQYVEAYRVYPQERTVELEHFAGGIAWKLQGADPLARVLVVLSLNLLDPVLDAMEKPQPEPERRRREDLQLVNAHPEMSGRNYSRVSLPAGALRDVPRRDARPRHGGPAPRTDGAVPGGGARLRTEHRGKNASLAAQTSRALHPQPRAGEPRTERVAVRSDNRRTINCG